MFVVIKRRYTMVNSDSTAKELHAIKSEHLDSEDIFNGSFTDQGSEYLENCIAPGNVNSNIYFSSNDTLFSSAKNTGLQLDSPMASDFIIQNTLIETPDLTSSDSNFTETKGLNCNQGSVINQESQVSNFSSMASSPIDSSNAHFPITDSYKSRSIYSNTSNSKHFKTFQLLNISSSSENTNRDTITPNSKKTNFLNYGRVISVSDLSVEKKIKASHNTSLGLNIVDKSTFTSYKVSDTPFKLSKQIEIPQKSLYTTNIQEDSKDLSTTILYMHKDDYQEYCKSLKSRYMQLEEEFLISLKAGTNTEKFVEILTAITFEDLNCDIVRHSIAVLGFCYEFGLGVKCDYAKSERFYKPCAIKGNALGQSRLAFLKKYGRPGIKIDRTLAAKWALKVKLNSESSATSWLEKASYVYGLAEAQYALGLCYHDGIGVNVDDKKAFQLYLKSAKQGNSRGQGILGYCYGEGFGVKQNKQEAVKWYMLAATQGESVAMYNLGYCYEDGIGVARKPLLAVLWYRKAAKKGNAFAQNSLGYCHEDGLGVKKDPKEAVKWYQLSAMQGYPWAECNLGYCYQYGIGVKENPAQATYWYLRAAKQGHARAQHNLGYCYQNGIWVEKDEKKAVMWYHKAAEKGNIYAYHSLGYCYQNGTGVGIQLKEAVKWYKMAAVKNHPPAQLSLGYCYRNGIGVEKNDNKAFKWFQESAKSGNALAQNSLGYCYEEGIGTPQNLKLAFHFYTKSASQNNPWAICNVGYSYAQGIGVAQNLEKAVYLYRIAAQMNHGRAMEKLGLALLEGVGTEKNEEQAVMWFKKAAEKFNHAPAMHWLGVCLERGIGVEADQVEAIKWYQNAIINGDSTAIERLRSLLVIKCNDVNKNNSSTLLNSFDVSSAA
ncbi:hypothetical protein BB561_005403 [Smittium simulii]|uniref:HCP-like protein n=1 Tax=Smittium simulii TaxID=133385 RepID=A0A2T9YAM1_9FUNG|nr:hypothetical protein BB561_005403 [Smittium simulii]